MTIVRGSVFIRPLDRRRPQSSLPVVMGGGTACLPAVTEGIATDEETAFHLLLLINLIPHRRAMVPLPLPGEGLMGCVAQLFALVENRRCGSTSSSLCISSTWLKILRPWLEFLESHLTTFDGPPSPSRGRLKRCVPLPSSFR